MPCGLLPTGLAAWAPTLRSVAPVYQRVQNSERIDETLVVEWRTKRVRVPEQSVEFGGGVRATYGQTILTAERMTLKYKERTGLAEGNVLLVDPTGTLSANRIEFSWAAKTGSADSAAIVAEHVTLRVSRLDVKSTQWRLFDVDVRPSKGYKQDFFLLAGRVDVRPGERVRLIKPKLSLLGLPAVQLPDVSYSLSRRFGGLAVPSITYRSSEGVGIALRNELPLGDRSGLTATYAAFPARAPRFSAELATSGLASEVSQARLSPESDLTERFGRSFLDQVSVRTPDAERRDLAQRRRTLAVGSYFNQIAVDRTRTFEEISKQLEVTLDLADSVGPLAGELQTRFQSIRPDSHTPFRERAAIRGAIYLGPFPLTRQLDFVARADSEAYLWGQGTYAWSRLMGEAIFSPTPRVRLSAGLFSTASAGDSQFDFDEPNYRRGLHARLDLNLKSISLSLLAKYDLGSHQWYSKDIYFSFIAGSFEPYVAIRQKPSDVRFGVRIRVDALLQRLSQRRFDRRATATQPRRSP